MSNSIYCNIKSFAEFKKKRAAFALLVDCESEKVRFSISGEFTEKYTQKTVSVTEVFVEYISGTYFVINPYGIAGASKLVSSSRKFNVKFVEPQ